VRLRLDGRRCVAVRGFAAYREVTSSFFVEVVLQTKILGGGLAKIAPQLKAMAASAILGLGLFLVPFLRGAWGCATASGRFPAPPRFSRRGRFPRWCSTAPTTGHPGSA
jgi:hypothetical protein